MSLGDFWAVTPRETLEYIEAWVEREYTRKRQRAEHAWNVAYLYRAKEFPDLAEWLPPELEIARGEKPEMSPVEEWTRWLAIAAQANAIDEQRKAQGLA